MGKNKITIIYSGHQLDYLYGLISGFLNKDIYVDIIDAERTDYDVSKLQGRNVRIFKLLDKTKPQTIFWLSFTWLRYYLKLFWYLISNDSKIIHIEWINYKLSAFEEVFLTVLYKFLRKKIVFKVHELDTKALLSENKTYTRNLSISKKFFLNNVDLFFVHNDCVKHKLLENDVPLSKIKKSKLGINNFIPRRGISTEAARQYFSIPANSKVILFFGNVSPYKGLDLLIDVFEDISKTFDNSYLLIGGNFRKGISDYKDYIFNKIKKVNNNKIITHFKFIPNTEVEYFFSASDLLCLPYEFINQSALPFLSYSFGIPVFANNIGGIPEDIEDGKTGIIFKNREELYANLVNFFNNRFALLSRNDIIRYSNNKYSWSEIIDNYIEYYKVLRK